MLTKPSLALAAVILFLLAIAPVYGAPSLSLGSTAKYDLAAKATVTQSCTSDPISFAYQACTGIVPPQPPPILGQPFLNEDFNYQTLSQVFAAGWTQCGTSTTSQYSIANSVLTLANNGSAAATVCWNKAPPGTANWSVWVKEAATGGSYASLPLIVSTTSHQYYFLADAYYPRFAIARDNIDPIPPTAIGSYNSQFNVYHTIRMTMSNNVLTTYFDEVLIFTYTENDPGTNLSSITLFSNWRSTDSYDIVTAAPVTPAPPTILPPPAPKTFEVDASGNVGWMVEGLSSTRANLVVSHNIAVSVPLGLFSFTPVTESGSFPQSIDLATRQESPGTATALLKAIMSATLPITSGLTTSSSPTLSTMLANINGPDYTQWWVNGPLSDGSPVQIMQGWSTVTGSESLNLGSILGTRNAWMVTSEVTQTVNTSIPNVTNPLGSPNISTMNLDLNLLWSFDKTADLLLRNNDTISLTTHSNTPVPINSLSPCTGPVCIGCTEVCPVVNVIRDTSIKANLTLLLSSTSLKLNGQGPATPAQTQTPTLMQSLASLPWVPLGVAGLLASGVAGLVILFARKTRRNLPPVAPVTWPGPNSQPS